LELQASSVSEKFLTTSVNAELNLFYNNVKKFETTATGVTVTGSTTTSNVLIVNGANTRNLSTNGSGYLTVSNAANSAAIVELPN